MYKICPHCFGEYQEHDGVSISTGVEICDACADGGAAFAAFDEWLNTKTTRQTFAEWMLESIGYEIKEDSNQPGMWLWVAPHGEASEVSFHSMEEAIADAQRHARGKESSRLRLVLDVEYNLNGDSIEAMQNNLRRLVDLAVEEGLLTGSGNAEVEDYSTNVYVCPDISEDELADYFAAQIEDGRISPSEVAVKLARYGLMDPSEFAMEMQERIEMAKEE
jgi:hypothetical protein